jgi:hypothetical protein
MVDICLVAGRAYSHQPAADDHEIASHDHRPNASGGGGPGASRRLTAKPNPHAGSAMLARAYGCRRLFPEVLSAPGSLPHAGTGLARGLTAPRPAAVGKRQPPLANSVRTPR